MNSINSRIISLDVTRGAIMVLLAAESCGLYDSLNGAFSTGLANLLILQFFHHEWHGLRFWDLVQPSFMLIAGTSLYLSWQKKKEKGITWKENFGHVGWRSFRLFLCGVGLHCIYAGELVWELWNVLTQLAFTTLIAYLIIQWPFYRQLLVSVLLLVITELLYRLVLVPGYDQPFVKGENFGAYFDMLLMGKHNDGGWAAINLIPTAAHTIWGVLVGKLLISAFSLQKKIAYLIYAAAVSLAVGYLLDWAAITPIIKRISTSSFVFVSGGYVLLILAFLVWLIDVKKYNKFAWIFIVVGMNPIFIYLFFESVGKQWFNGAVDIFVGGALSAINIPADPIAIAVALITLLLEWYLCYWLYQRRIFFKL